ncbi:MAG: hypothetical protein AB2L22_18245 [Syntrophales bacterium]
MKVRPEDGNPGVYRVTPPTCRVDLTREIDLIEEVARLHGYDRIPVTLPAVTGVAVCSGSRAARGGSGQSPPETVTGTRRSSHTASFRRVQRISWPFGRMISVAGCSKS